MSRLEPNKRSFKSVLSNIKASLHRVKWKEALTLLAFILLASGFWLMQNLQQEYEVEMNIPIKYRNVPPELSFTSTPPEYITIRVKDKGSILLNYVLWRSFLPFEINLKDLPANTSQAMLADRQKIESEIQKQLISSSTLTYTEPTSITLSYGKLEEKEVAVIFDGIIETKAGFQLVDEAVITPSKVKLYANRAVLDSVDTVYTEFQHLTNVDKSLALTLKLKKPEGSSLNPETIIFSAPIEEFTEKVLTIPVTCSNLPKMYELKTFPSSVSLSCNVSVSRFKDLDAFAFEIDIPFDSLKNNKSGTVRLELTKQPSWINNPVISPNTIEFILEQKAASTPKGEAEENVPQDTVVEE